ncbi:hypothetical protein HPB50_008739 [Hyalomma asiaticum]|uniref:Uncharacterized protein n=1 Tax=Hyalomma asiaticum TaxID=266040 RepID=A0ACB7SJ51_HYAAI|nr:hypothetical protein HPB50_008739 [Hyalomma asiaticum]
MLRNGGTLQTDQALLGWSMLDHDDTFADNYVFDEFSSPSLERSVQSPDAVCPSDPANLRFVENSTSKQGSAASPLSSLARLKRSTEAAATIQERPRADVRDSTQVAHAAASVKQPHTAGGENSGRPKTNAWISNFVQDSSRQIAASSTVARVSRRRRRVLDAHLDQCVIEESSSEDSAEAGSCRDTTDAAMIVDEASESESSGSIHTPLLQSPQFHTTTSLPALRDYIGQSDLDDLEAGTNEAAENFGSKNKKRGVVKKGLEALLVFARQKEGSSKSLAARRKFFQDAESLARDTLLLRVLTVENVYGVAYCACVVCGEEKNAGELCLQVPWELVAREELCSGDVVRIYPPWSEYELHASPGKIISGARYVEVVERYTRETTEG